MTEQTTRIRVSDHAERRWLERSDAPCMNALNAWEAAKPIYGHGLDGDEVRYHSFSETVLVRKNSNIVTVIDAQTASMSVRRAVYHFGGGQA